MWLSFFHILFSLPSGQIQSNFWCGNVVAVVQFFADSHGEVWATEGLLGVRGHYPAYSIILPTQFCPLLNPLLPFPHSLLFLLLQQVASECPTDVERLWPSHQCSDSMQLSMLPEHALLALCSSQHSRLQGPIGLGCKSFGVIFHNHIIKVLLLS